MERGVEEGGGEGVVSKKVKGEVHLWSGGWGMPADSNDSTQTDSLGLADWLTGLGPKNSKAQTPPQA